MAYPQNGDRIVAIDSVTSLHPMNSICYVRSLAEIKTKVRPDQGELNSINTRIRAERDSNAGKSANRNDN